VPETNLGKFPQDESETSGPEENNGLVLFEEIGGEPSSAQLMRPSP
jgi:hypothetical protein